MIVHEERLDTGKVRITMDIDPETLHLMGEYLMEFLNEPAEGADPDRHSYLMFMSGQFCGVADRLRKGGPTHSTRTGGN